MNELFDKITSKVNRKIVLLLVIIVLIFYLIYNKENLDANMSTLNLWIDYEKAEIDLKSSPDARKILLTYATENRVIQDNTTI